MALVDYEALVMDFRQELRNGRVSWGRAQLLERLDQLEGRHRIDESADEATLRRFSGHLTDTFFAVSPRPATEGPLASDDRETSPADGLRRSQTDGRGGHDGSQNRAAAASAHA